jgi:hypothetical protein
VSGPTCTTWLSLKMAINHREISVAHLERAAVLVAAAAASYGKRAMAMTIAAMTIAASEKVV